MALTKQKGDVAELMVAADLRRRGYKLLIPFGEECDYDLVIERDDRLERVQVKYTESDGSVIEVRCSSHSLTNGRIRATKRYTARTIDWLAVYDKTTSACYYIPAIELANGRMMMSLRLVEAKSGRTVDVHWAKDYRDLDGHQAARY